MRALLIAGTILAALVSGSALAAGGTHTGRLETCLKAALAHHAGEVRTLEAELSAGKPIYEFDIRGSDGKEWEIECDAKTGKIIEEEQELAAGDPAFTAAAKISLEDARKAALVKCPGVITETEYSIEADGRMSYEFDIRTADGKEIEVEIDAASGAVVESEEEIYQIGEEK